MREFKRRDIHNSAIDEPLHGRHAVFGKRQRSVDMELLRAVRRHRRNNLLGQHTDLYGDLPDRRQRYTDGHYFADG